MPRGYEPSPCPTCGRMIGKRQMGRHRLKHDDPLALTIPDAEQTAQIIHLYKTMGMAEVARRTHWSVNAVRNTLVAAGVERRPQHVALHPRRGDVEAELKTAELYGKGFSMTEVARLMDVNPSTVYYRLHRVGARIRPQHIVKAGR